MNKEVVVNVKGYQTDSDGNTDVTEENFEAMYYNRSGTQYIMYEDERTAKSARYKFNHRYLEVIRNGDISAKLTFEVGKCCRAIYRTPYGRMPFVFDTTQVMLSEKPGEIKIETVYSINNEGTLVSNNRTVITIVEK